MPDIKKPNDAIIGQYKMIAPETATDEMIWKCYCDCDGDDDKVQETIGSWWVSTMEDDTAGPPAPAQPSPVKKPPPPPKSRSGGGDAKAEEEEDDEADKKEKKKKEKKEKKEKKKPPDRRSSARSAQSQVRLLAEHCFTLSDEAVQSLVRYRIPTQSKWDFKQKQHVRDETIKHLQRALDLLNQEKQRFKSACVDIETSLQDELTATKNNLAVAASGGGGGGGGGVVFSSGGADAGAMQSLRDDLAEAKSTIKSKEKDASEAVNKSKDLEKKATELNEQLMRAHFEKREGESDKTRAAEEVYRLSQELANSRKALEMKNKELSTALASFADHQKKAEDRAMELGAMSRGNDDRVSELEKEKNTLLNEMSDLKAKVSISSSEADGLKDQLKEMKTELDELRDSHKELSDGQGSVLQKYENEKALKERAQQMEDNERRERIAACAQLLAIQQHTETVIGSASATSDREVSELKSKLTDQKELIAELKADLKEASSKLAAADGELAGMRHSLKDATENGEAAQKLSAAMGQIATLEEKIKQTELESGEGKAALEGRIKELEAQHKEETDKVFSLEAERRKLQNQVQELRGNVRVFCRLRPFLPNDKRKEGEESVLTVGMDMCSITLRDPNKPKEDKGAYQKFKFDRTWAAHEGQEDVFKDVSEFVQSALDGYNVTLFSYGQTGSGKTHSMQGSGNEQMRGIIPRAIEQVGQTKLKLMTQGWEFQMKVQYVEIYNEVVKDLLSSETKDLKILRDAYGMTEIDGVVMMEIEPENKREVDDVMGIAAKNRSVCKTDMNAESSRSHSIFTLHLVARNDEQNAVLRGQLNLCDLAGSERVDRSGAQGKALAEAKNINKSLSCLSNVFTAINTKSQHVPFRDSKLTYLLQPSFSGDGKTCMMINLSPTELSMFESLSTLRFGAMVNSCELGKAVRKLNDIDEDKKKLGKGKSADGDGKSGKKK